MEIKQCIMTNSLCYKQAGRVPQHFGIVVHSTGVNQPRISRYVQPSDNDPNKDAIIADIGKNPYNNDWNHPPKNPTAADRKGVHCFIGNNSAGEVVCYQVLPWDNIAWGVYKGDKGSYNDNPPYFQFEICEDGLTNEKYFNDCMTVAQMLCAYLCNNFEISVENIVSHYESWEQGYGNKHVDPNNWLSKFGKDMNWFREGVRKIMGQTVNPGDIGRVKEGAHVYDKNGKDLDYEFSAWVYRSDVIVGEVANGCAHFSTDLSLKSYTGWTAVENIIIGEKPKEEEKEKNEYREKYEKLLDDYKAVCNERNALAEKIDKIKAIL